MKRATVQGFTLSFVFIVLIYITLGCRSPRPEKEKSSLGIGNDATRSECEAN